MKQSRKHDDDHVSTTNRRTSREYRIEFRCLLLDLSVVSCLQFDYLFRCGITVVWNAHKYWEDHPPEKNALETNDYNAGSTQLWVRLEPIDRVAKMRLSVLSVPCFNS
jgi:hypothetical protein